MTIKIPSIIKLPGKNNYAIIFINKIIFALDAIDEELKFTIAEEKCIYHESLTNFRKDNISYIPNRKSTSISFILTYDCNLKCIYCYAKGGDEKSSISLNIAKKAIKSVGPKCNFDHLNLYLVGGGEPLLKFNLVKEVVSFAESIFNSVRLHIVSNGTFNREVLDWISDRDCRIRISFDGFSQNEQRPYRNYKLNSSIIVKKNIIELVKRNVPLTVQCIVTNKSLPHLKDTILEIAKMGVKTVKIEPMLATNISRGSKDLMPNPVLYADALLDGIRFISNTKLDIKLDTGYFSVPSLGPYCGIGYTNCNITPEGLITGCIEVSRHTEPYANLIIYGKVTDNGLYINKKKKREIKKSNPTTSITCETCNIRLICQGGCPMANIWQTGFPPNKSPYTCAIEKRLIPPLLLEIATNPKVSEILLENVEISECSVNNTL